MYDHETGEMPREWTTEERAVMAQRLSRMLLAADDTGLERFRHQHMRGAPHATLDDLRDVRSILERLFDQLQQGDTEGWRRVSAALEVLEPTSDFDIDDEPTSNATIVQPQRLDRPADGRQATPAVPAFFQALSPVMPTAPHHAQNRTMTVDHELSEMSRAVDAVVSWTVEDWARLVIELEAYPDAEAAVWARHGVEGSASIREAIRAGWKMRLRDPEIKRRFSAHVTKLRFFAMVPKSPS